MNEDELEITNENFNEYFHDVRKCAPQKGEVMVCYAARAEFVEGREKLHMIHLLQKDGKIEAAMQVMRKLLFASEKDAFRVPKEILQDLISGMTEEEVLRKPYPYTVEMFFYTKPEYMPKNDPHWSQITLLNLDDFLASKEKSDKTVAELLEKEDAEQEDTEQQGRIL
jgi:hypothetical protein